MVSAASFAMDAGGGNCSAVPRIETKNAISLGDRVPPFDIMQRRSVSMPRPYVFGIELRFELAHLLLAKLHHFVLTIRTGFGLLSWTTGISLPRFSAPSRACRSIFGDCGTQ